jgi:hypothetical protein
MLLTCLTPTPCHAPPSACSQLLKEEELALALHNFVEKDEKVGVRVVWGGGDPCDSDSQQYVCVLTDAKPTRSPVCLEPLHLLCCDCELRIWMHLQNALADCINSELQERLKGTATRKVRGKRGTGVRHVHGGSIQLQGVPLVCRLPLLCLCCSSMMICVSRSHNRNNRLGNAWVTRGGHHQPLYM